MQAEEMCQNKKKFCSHNIKHSSFWYLSYWENTWRHQENKQNNVNSAFFKYVTWII